MVITTSIVEVGNSTKFKCWCKQWDAKVEEIVGVSTRFSNKKMEAEAKR